MNIVIMIIICSNCKKIR